MHQPSPACLHSIQALVGAAGGAVARAGRPPHQMTEAPHVYMLAIYMVVHGQRTADCRHCWGRLLQASGCATDCGLRTPALAVPALGDACTDCGPRTVDCILQFSSHGIAHGQRNTDCETEATEHGWVRSVMDSPWSAGSSAVLSGVCVLLSDRCFAS